MTSGCPEQREMMSGDSVEKLELEIAKAICELNCWETPSKIMSVTGRKLNEDEVRIAMDALQAFVPHSKWIKVWRQRTHRKALAEDSSFERCEKQEKEV